MFIGYWGMFSFGVVTGIVLLVVIATITTRGGKN